MDVIDYKFKKVMEDEYIHIINRNDSDIAKLKFRMLMEGCFNIHYPDSFCFFARENISATMRSRNRLLHSHTFLG